MTSVNSPRSSASTKQSYSSSNAVCCDLPYNRDDLDGTNISLPCIPQFVKIQLFQGLCSSWAQQQPVNNFLDLKDHLFYLNKGITLEYFQF